MNQVGKIEQLTERESNLSSVFASIANIIPTFLSTEQITASLKWYRYQPEHIASILDAMSQAMQSEHYRHDGELSDALHDNGERVADVATDLRVYAKREREIEANEEARRERKLYRDSEQEFESEQGARP